MHTYFGPALGFVTDFSKPGKVIEMDVPSRPHIEIKDENSVVVTDPGCGDKFYLIVHEKDIERWVSGVHAQNAFPYLNADERELLMTGTCSNCWDDMFRGAED